MRIQERNYITIKELLKKKKNKYSYVSPFKLIILCSNIKETQLLLLSKIQRNACASLCYLYQYRWGVMIIAVLQGFKNN